jgi:acid stress-induced BolA-like protein IbaG/YrbA
MTPEFIKSRIEAGLPGSQVFVEGDGQHFQAVVVSAEFTNQTMLKQHQMVYATLGEAMGSDIHALSIRTLTPEQWQQSQQ